MERIKLSRKKISFPKTLDLTLADDKRERGGTFNIHQRNGFQIGFCFRACFRKIKR